MSLQEPGKAEPVNLFFRDRWEIVFEELRERILTGQMPPGSQIREVELAETFGVSRGPVREAIRELQVIGLVNRGPRQPTYVAAISTVDIDEVFTLREAIEGLAVQRMIENSNAAVFDKLGELSDAVERAVAESAPTMQIVDADIAFVTAFYDNANNSRLRGVWATIIDPLRNMLRLGMHREDPNWQSRWTGHAEIAAACSAGDVETAVRLVRERISGGRVDLIRFVNEQA